jgi:hypothetical protein
MPVVAAFIDRMRAAYGAELVNAQMAEGQAARREHAQVLAEQGAAAAARWHRTNADRCTFCAEEAGRTIGLASPFGVATPKG